jgi:hypothetical protein
VEAAEAAITVVGEEQGNKMKLFSPDKILFSTIILVSFFISGCYTVIWTPEDEFPNDENYNNDPGYYIDNYYYYYDYPWWYTITPPSPKTKNGEYERDRNNNINKIRNNGDGRRTEEQGREVLNTPPPTVDSDSDKNTGNTSAEVKSNVSNSTPNLNKSSRQNSGNSSNNVRNNNGSRNNGRGR